MAKANTKKMPRQMPIRKVASNPYNNPKVAKTGLNPVRRAGGK